jgi:hypothetical protein
MHAHAPAHATYPVSGRLLALIYAAVVIVLVFSSVAVLASRSHVFGSPDASAGTTGPSAVHSVHVGAYELRVGSLPTHIGEQTAVSVRLLQDGRAVSGARVEITFAMPSMPGMHGPSARLRQTARGVYATAAPILTVGTWRASFHVTPQHGKSFSGGFTFRVGA